MKFVYNPFTNKLDPTDSGGGGGGGITTISGDTGSITGSDVNIVAGLDTVACGATVKFENSGTTSTLKVSDVAENIFIGPDTGNVSLTGNGNLGIGIYSSNALTTGSTNVSLGYGALSSATEGTGNVSIGTSSMGQATGSVNTAIGIGSLRYGSKNNNIAIGNGAFDTFGFDGEYNIGLGFNVGGNYTSGTENNNIILGSLNNGVNGESNVLRIGKASGTGLGELNKAFIHGIYNNNSSGFTTPLPVYVGSNGQLGYGAAGGGGGVVTINGDSGSITGTTVKISSGLSVNNCGATVKFQNSGTSSTLNVSDVVSNTFIGNGSGGTYTPFSASANVMLGDYSALGLTTGIANTGVGNGACQSVADGGYNSVLGQNAFALNAGSFNVAIGCVAVQNGTSNCTFNIGIGYGALTATNFDGSNNIGIGYNTGSNYTAGTESSNILIGNQTAGTSGESHVLRIGNATGAGSGNLQSAFIQGISGATVTGATVLCSTSGQLGTISSSRKYKENIQDISDSSILNLRPVKFNYISDESKSSVYGLIAEEVQETFPDLVLYRDGAPDSIKYHELPALLLAEIQRLNKRIEALESK